MFRVHSRSSSQPSRCSAHKETRTRLTPAALFSLVVLVTILLYPAVVEAVTGVSTIVDWDDVPVHPREDPAVIGIELGRAYGAVAVYKEGKVEILENDQGSLITPSWVSFSEDQILVGQLAKDTFQFDPRNTLFRWEKLLGRNMSDPEVQENRGHWPYIIKDRGGVPVIQVEHKGENMLFTPEEVSAMLIGKLKETAEAYLGAHATSAVITVPVYFTDAQRQATKDAGRIAGFDDLRVISEPIAAAIAYGIDKKSNGDEIKILAYHLGSEAFDVSIHSVEEGVFEVLSTTGDTHLGEDFKSRVVGYSVEAYETKYHRTAGKGETRKDVVTTSRLEKAVGDATRVLSTIKIEIESFSGGQDLAEELQRVKSSELNADLFRKPMESVELVIRDAGLQKEDIEEVVLFGDLTGIPEVQQMLKEYFNKDPVLQVVGPGEAVVYGAALLAGILSGAMYRDVLLGAFEITTLSLGVETIGDMFSPLIQRFTIAPTRKSQIYSTALNGQQDVLIKVYEGDRSQTKFNHFLGQFELKGIPLAPQGVPQIEVTFELDADLNLNVSATEKVTGRSESIQIVHKRDRLSYEDIERMQLEAEQFSEDLLSRRLLESANHHEGCRLRDTGEL